ncbi:MAG: TrpB-like pyridoxal phosphate-dependent enzyme [Actinomycetes bacterium]|jgi:tryptophan synthase beta chain|nr:TrpB-like pyridoxal phosphate-dependent enzyme [Actinomycetes bacterium]
MSTQAKATTSTGVAAASKHELNRFVLAESELPTAWYNVQADLPELPAPYLDAEGNPARPEQLAAIFPPDLIEQEMTTQRYIDIPGAVIDVLRTYRPGPLTRARMFEKALGLPGNVHIYYKYEGINASGSHKANTAIPQAYYNKKAGITKLTTETGAGQWGSALSMAGSQLGLDIEVFMVGVSYDQKPYRRIFMESFGAKIHRSPTRLTHAGRAVLEETPETLGSLAIAISEAVEIAAMSPDTNYSLGSVLNHVLLHQTIIGQEAIAQMELAEDEPDVVIGCCGGGSNFGGIAFPYYHRRLEGKTKARLLAVEPKACPSLTRGEYRYDFGDEAKMTPQMMMYTLGHDFVPAGIHAGGLRYHGDSPLVSKLYNLGEIEAVSVHQTDCFEAALAFGRAEALLPAPESSHAIAAAVAEARAAAEAGEKKTILFNLTGHGFLDLAAYDAYNKGTLQDYDFSAGAQAG